MDDNSLLASCTSTSMKSIFESTLVEVLRIGKDTENSSSPLYSPLEEFEVRSKICVSKKVASIDTKCFQDGR